jgi:hypothetical protein
MLALKGTKKKRPEPSTFKARSHRSLIKAKSGGEMTQTLYVHMNKRNKNK